LEKLELFKIFLTSGLTITGGVLIFVLGQMILKFVIEPIHEFNKLKGEIAYSLVFYANVYMNVPLSYTDLSEDRQDRDKAQQVFRGLASQLCPRARIIPWLKIWESLKFVPKYKNIIEATKDLIGLSNSIHEVTTNVNRMRRERIEAHLNIQAI